MNRNTFSALILLFFAGGFAGYSLNHWMGEPSEKTTEISQNKQEEQNQKPANPPVPAIRSTVLLETVLPNTSPGWVSINFKKLKDNQHRFEDVFQLSSIKKIISDFSSAFPHGATETLHYLYDNTDRLELFLLPPEPGVPEIRFAAAFPYKQSDDENQDHPLFSHWQNLFPDAEIHEERMAEMTFQTMETPIGVYTGIVTENVAWFSNHTAGLKALFTHSAQMGDAKNPRDTVHKRYPDAAITLYLNAAKESAETMALPGMIPQMLMQYGVNKAVIAYQLHDDGVRISGHAPSDVFPEWAKNWLPFSAYPFTSDDPMGLMELAFMMPVLHASGEVEAVQADVPNAIQRDVEPGKEVHLDTSLTAQSARVGIRSKGDRTENQMPIRMMLHFFPQGAVSGINVFGFFKNQPTLALRFSELDRKPAWMDSLSSEDIGKDEVEIGMIPAVHYHLQSSELAKTLNRKEVVILERDAVTYVFDSPLAGKNYFGDANSDPTGKNRRKIQIRAGLQQVDEHAQIKGVLTKDWFSRWLDDEIKKRKRIPSLQREIKQLRDDITPQLQPLHFSAGIRDQEWFLDSYVETADGHLVDLFLLSTMLHASAKK